MKATPLSPVHLLMRQEVALKFELDWDSEKVWHYLILYQKESKPPLSAQPKHVFLLKLQITLFGKQNQ